MRQIAISLEKHPQLEEDPVTALTETFVNTNQALLGTYLPTDQITHPLDTQTTQHRITHRLNNRSTPTKHC